MIVKTGSRLVKKTLYLDKEDLDFIEKYSIENNILSSAIFREAIKNYVSGLKSNNVINDKTKLLYKEFVKQLYIDFNKINDKNILVKENIEIANTLEDFTNTDFNKFD